MFKSILEVTTTSCDCVFKFPDYCYEWTYVVMSQWAKHKNMKAECMKGATVLRTCEETRTSARHQHFKWCTCQCSFTEEKKKEKGGGGVCWITGIGMIIFFQVFFFYSCLSSPLPLAYLGFAYISIWLNKGETCKDNICKRSCISPLSICMYISKE